MDRPRSRLPPVAAAALLALLIVAALGARFGRADEPPTPRAGSLPPPGPVAGGPPDSPPPLPAAPPEVAAVPDLRRAFADIDAGGIGESYSSAPAFIGDGGGPMMSAGRISVGRIMISASGLDSALAGQNPADLNLVADPAFNSIQAIAAAGYPFFVIPTQPLGSVPGTPPVQLSGSPGIGTVTDPGGLYEAVAEQAFDSSLPGTLGGRGAAVFVPEASGTLPDGAGNLDAFLFYNFVVDSSIVFPGYAVGFVKLTENMSPLPRDRVYMNYSYFRNANFWGTRADANRFMPGFEKTFADGWTSLEIRTPFAATLDNVQDLGFTPGGTAELSELRDVQFGNMSVIFKTLLVERDTWALTGGLQLMLPTASDTFVFGPSAALPAGETIQQVFVANESVHAMPFVGWLWAPNDRFFNQALLQVDTDVNGNLAYVNALQDPNVSGRSLTQVGRVRYPTFLYLSFGTGWWLHRDDRARFSGFAPVMELHLNQALEEFQPIRSQGYQLGQNPGLVSVINGLVGCNFEWGTRSTLSLAFVTPLGGGLDRFFDGELRALWNWRFGPQTRLARAQF
jgi:hypothetical protein